jgi:putative mycofactocin binding protein MftB
VVTQVVDRSDDSGPVGFDPSLRYVLDSEVALRAEPFGALAYNYSNRRLTFLRSIELRELVRSLADFDSADEAVRQSLPEASRPAYLHALRNLAESGMIRAS